LKVGCGEPASLIHIEAVLDLAFRGRRLRIVSPLAADEVTERLRSAIAPARWLRDDRQTSAFEGTFEGGQFRVVRRVKGRHSFRPVIHGRVAAAAAGTAIDLELRLHPLVVAVSVVLLAVAVLVAALAVQEWIAAGAEALQLAVIPAIGAGALVVSAVSSAEARRAVTLLRSVVGADAGSTASAR
jgi:hypothetical protein